MEHYKDWTSGMTSPCMLRDVTPLTPVVDNHKSYLPQGHQAPLLRDTNSQNEPRELVVGLEKSAEEQQTWGDVIVKDIFILASILVWPALFYQFM